MVKEALLISSIALFVQMGSALPKGGPAGLFLGFIIWSVVMLAVNECFGMLRDHRMMINETITNAQSSGDGVLHARSIALCPIWQRVGG